MLKLGWIRFGFLFFTSFFGLRRLQIPYNMFTGGILLTSDVGNKVNISCVGSLIKFSSCYHLLCRVLKSFSLYLKFRRNVEDDFYINWLHPKKNELQLSYCPYVRRILNSCEKNKWSLIFYRSLMKQIECLTWDLSQKFVIYWAKQVQVCHLVLIVTFFFSFYSFSIIFLSSLLLIPSFGFCLWSPPLSWIQSSSIGYRGCRIWQEKDYKGCRTLFFYLIWLLLF